MSLIDAPDDSVASSLLTGERVAGSGEWLSTGSEEEADPCYNKDTGIVTLVLTFAVTSSTSAQMVTEMNLSAITAPVAGKTPEKFFSVDKFSNQYWASVAWSQVPSGGRFANNTEYTATVTLTAVSGYTFTGIPAK
jgi:hypothetical protein